MAKKKATRKKKSARKSSRKWIGWLLLILMVGVGGYLLYQHYLLTRKSPSEGIELPADKKEQPRPTVVPPSASKKIEKSESEKKSKPEVKSDTAEKKETRTAKPIRSFLRTDCTPSSRKGVGKVVRYTHYSVLFDTVHRVPLWVAYELTAEEARGTIPRKKSFEIDRNLYKVSSTNADYTRSGYDRGHLAPAADMAFSREAMDESFYFTNVAPQDPSLNKGSWKTLEEMVRRWAEQDSGLYITSGTVVGNKPTSIGPNHVAVPRYFYKAVVSVSDNRLQGIGFVYKNEATKQSPFFYAVPIDSIERLTGFDLYHTLPDSLEERMEQHSNIEWWRIKDEK